MCRKTGITVLVFSMMCMSRTVFPQPVCTTPGQTPSTAFPVCGTTVFQQSSVPICFTSYLHVPGCYDNAGYGDKNPFFYKFTCYVSGTLGFVITPLAPNEDYDWQLYDITGRNPNDIFWDTTMVVTGNWAGTYGPTGASATGVTYIQCASDPAANLPTFARMPVLTAGREYLLLVSHFTDTQSGYTLSFGGGTAVITDPASPHMQQAKTDCAGEKITLKLNKKLRCNSLTSSGSEFSLVPAVTTITSAATTTCIPGFDFTEITLTLASPLPGGNYQLVINNGTDGNTLIDFCDNRIPQGESIPFTHTVAQPIFADSIGRLGCATDSLKVYFPKRIVCSSIAADGSDFSISGTPAINISGAYGNCIDDKTDYVVVKFSSPVYTQGNYQLTLKAGNDGTVLMDECNLETPTQTLPFTTADTVSAVFTFTAAPGCRNNQVSFTHNGAHNVNSWNWIINNSAPVTLQNFTHSFPASSSNNVQLTVSNGVCSDSYSKQLVMDNEVKADFAMTDIMCPEDGLQVTNHSSGPVDSWKWEFAHLGTSFLKDPPPFRWPLNNRQSYYTVKLIVTNNALGCSDTAKKSLTVLNNCIIAVPSAFTPNGDGLNDFLSPHNALKADNLDFRVYNRWGQLVFHSRHWTEKWDGRLNGVPQTTGTYVWMLSYTHRDTGEKIFQKGTVTLIR
jgi:gliding motility-associated-like protein